MDNQITTASARSTQTLFQFASVEATVRWSYQPAPSLRLLADDDFEDDLEEEGDEDWTEDDDLEEDDDWSEDDDLDDDLDDDDEDDFDEEEDDDFDDDWVEEEDEGDDYEYEYRGDPSWDVDDDLDDDEPNLLGTRFSSLLDNPPSGPRRFRDRDGAPKGDKKPRKSHRPRVTDRRRGEIENDDE